MGGYVKMLHDILYIIHIHVQLIITIKMYRKVQRLDEIAELKKKLETELKEAERLRLVR